MFYLCKTPNLRENVGIDKVVLPNKICFGETKNCKYFIGYLHNVDEVKLLYIMPPKTSASIKSYYRQSKWMYALIEDKGLLKKYKTNWDKVSADIYKKEF